MKILFNNVKSIVMYVFTAFIAASVLYAIHIILSVPTGSIPILSQVIGGPMATIADFINTHFQSIEKVLTGIIVFLYIFRGLILKDCGSILKNFLSVLGLTALLAAVEVCGLIWHGSSIMTNVLVVAHAPIYTMLMSQTKHFEPAAYWYLAVPMCFIFIGLYMKIGMKIAIMSVIKMIVAKRHGSNTAEV